MNSFYRPRGAYSFEGDFGLGKGPFCWSIGCHIGCLYDIIFVIGITTLSFQGLGLALMELPLLGFLCEEFCFYEDKSFTEVQKSKTHVLLVSGEGSHR